MEAQSNIQKPNIRIVLNGGLVTDVEIPGELAERVTIRVEDEDVEGLDEGEIHRDHDGREYYLSTWP